MSEGAAIGPVRRFLSLALIVVGVMWIAASGLCSAAFLVSLLVEGGADVFEVLSILPMIALVGGFSAGAGFLVYVIGRALRPKQ